MRYRYDYNRSASLAITLFGALLNFLLTVQILGVWRNIKWEPEGEWEGTRDVWKIDSVKLAWGLLSAYFSASAAVSAVGFFGILKNKPAFVRFYRDYSIADFSFTSFFTVVGAYSAFNSSMRTSICEQLSRQPELMRDMVEMGLNLENCELWFERAVLAIVAIMFVLIVIRLHFLLAVSHYYSHLIRHHRAGLPLYTPIRSHAHVHHVHKNSNASSPQRIYLLPVSTPSASADSSAPLDDIMVYTPVPLSSLSENLRSTATQAWITRSECSTSSSADGHSTRARSHSHTHRHRRSNSLGRISLPIAAGEGLLPAYDDDKRDDDGAEAKS